jgi:hypothetical protein
MNKLFVFIGFAFVLNHVAHSQITDATFSAIEGRHIGPARMSGRIAAIDAVNSNPDVVWVGAAGGGIWKSKTRA